MVVQIVIVSDSLSLVLLDTDDDLSFEADTLASCLEAFFTTDFPLSVDLVPQAARFNNITADIVNAKSFFIFIVFLLQLPIVKRF